MNVLLLANYSNDGQESMQRFADFMAQGLTKAGHKVQLMRPAPVFGRLRPSSHGAGKWLGYVDKFTLFPPVLKAAVTRADVVHICDHSNAFYTRYLQSVAHVVTCHDLLAVRSALGQIPESRTGLTGRKLQRMIANGLTRAQRIACVSDTTRKDLLRLPGINEQRVSRVYNSLNYEYSPMERPEAAQRLRKLDIDPGQRFLLHVGGNQWYKNRLGLLRIFAALLKASQRGAFRLVLAGKPLTGEMRQFIGQNGLEDVVLDRNNVSNEDLRALYSSAVLMVFPSLYEGFGWPIVEAQACGCPVVTSNRAPMNEVGGSAAVYIDPEDAESAVTTLARAMEKAPSLRGPSLSNAARFTSGMIEGYLSLYEKVLNERGARISPVSSQSVPQASRCSAVGAE